MIASGQKCKGDCYLMPRCDLLVLLGSPRPTKRYPKLQGCFACSFDSFLTDEEDSMARSSREANCPLPCSFNDGVVTVEQSSLCGRLPLSLTLILGTAHLALSDLHDSEYFWIEYAALATKVATTDWSQIDRELQVVGLSLPHHLLS